MDKRARLSQASGAAASFMQADNAIDAVASGEDLSTVLSPGEHFSSIFLSSCILGLSVMGSSNSLAKDYTYCSIRSGDAFPQLVPGMIIDVILMALRTAQL